MTWSAEQTAMLRRLVRKGLNDTAIAARLGIGPRAVNGKRWRLGLTKDVEHPKREIDRKARAENEASWSAPPGMVKLRCQHCGFWFAAAKPPSSCCADCAMPARGKPP